MIDLQITWLFYFHGGLSAKLSLDWDLMVATL